MNPRAHAAALRLSLAAVLLALPAAAHAGATFVGDRIYRRNIKDPLVATVVSDTIDGIRLGGGSVTIPVQAVVHIDYAGAPQSYRTAEQKRRTRGFAEAIEYYEKALKITQRKFWLHQHCRFYIAECCLEDGELDKARTAYQDLLAKHPDTRFKPNAMLGLGLADFQSGKHGAALDRFQAVIKFAVEKNWKRWHYEGMLWKARALSKLKRYDDALKEIRKLIGAEKIDDYEVIQTQAKTEEALIFVGQGQFNEAIRLLNKHLDKLSRAVAREIEEGVSTRMQRLEAQAKNALGRCYLDRYKTSKKTDDVREALLAFLWTVTLYPNFPDERAEALKSAAHCFDVLAAEAPTNDEKIKNKSRARELREELEGGGRPE